MRMFRKIDLLTGNFIADVISDVQTPDMVDVAPAQGLYLPKWDFATETWTEGKTPEEIAVILASQPAPTPTADERLDNLEPKVTTLEQTIEVIFG